MKSVIEKIEKKLKEMGLEIGEKKQTDLMYIISVPVKEKGDFVIFTQKRLVEANDEKCFQLYQVGQHVPFNVVTPEKIEDFFWYIENYFLSRDLQIVLSNKEEDAAFLSIYLKEISGTRLDNFKYWFSTGISAEEVIRRMNQAVSIM